MKAASSRSGPLPVMVTGPGSGSAPLKTTAAAQQGKGVIVMGRVRRLLLPIVLMLAGLGSGCAVNQADIRGFNLISIEDEKQLGDKFAVEVEKQYAVVNDPQLQGYVEKIGRRLLTGAREVDFNYTFKVVKDDSVNAFAIPGGHVYVNTGLIKAAQNETELAGVMAHEINHAVARHGTRQLTQQYGYSLI